jgi:hypothetical protein
VHRYTAAAPPNTGPHPAVRKVEVASKFGYSPSVAILTWPSREQMLEVHCDNCKARFVA